MNRTTVTMMFRRLSSWKGGRMTRTSRLDFLLPLALMALRIKKPLFLALRLAEIVPAGSLLENSYRCIMISGAHA
jgi:hypothetical protein